VRHQAKSDQRRFSYAVPKCKSRAIIKIMATTLSLHVCLAQYRRQAWAAGWFCNNLSSRAHSVTYCAVSNPQESSSLSKARKRIRLEINLSLYLCFVPYFGYMTCYFLILSVFRSRRSGFFWTILANCACLSVQVFSVLTSTIYCTYKLTDFN
jgi:hypothetical protein